LTFLSDLQLARIAVIGALVAALGLAGCGRKGGLDPPPAGAAAGPDPAVVNDREPALGPDGQTVAPAGPKRRTPIDWLID
jgi:predicted small lipoprotein YifL